MNRKFKSFLVLLCAIACLTLVHWGTLYISTKITVGIFSLSQDLFWINVFYPSDIALIDKFLFYLYPNLSWVFSVMFTLSLFFLIVLLKYKSMFAFMLTVLTYQFWYTSVISLMLLMSIDSLIFNLVIMAMGLTMVLFFIKYRRF